MKYKIQLPFLWFKRGEVVDETRLRRADVRYLLSRKMIEECKPTRKKANKDG